MGKKKENDEKEKEEKDESEEDLKTQIENEETSAFNLARARQMASPEVLYLLIGSLGALMAGSIFPIWGLLFAETMDILFRPVLNCTTEFLEFQDYLSCDDYLDAEVQYLKETSHITSVYWAIIVLACVGGHIILFWGFGNASERMTRRTRDDVFNALVRQEVAFFDKRSVGKITSELQEDTTQVQTFTGDPIRQLLMALSGLLTGVVLSFYFMWQFALLSIVCIPFLGFATSIDMKTMMGEDDGDGNVEEEANSPGGIVVESLLNMGTVSALTMEEERYRLFEEALNDAEEHYVRQGLHQGALTGLAIFVQQWINALQFWFGGWLLFKYPDVYTFKDFTASLMIILFSLFALGAAFQDIADREKVEKSLSRIFYLLDKRSEIDPLSEEGKTINFDEVSKPNELQFLSRKIRIPTPILRNHYFRYLSKRW